MFTTMHTRMRHGYFSPFSAFDPTNIELIGFLESMAAPDRIFLLICASCTRLMVTKMQADSLGFLKCHLIFFSLSNNKGEKVIRLRALRSIEEQEVFCTIQITRSGKPKPTEGRIGPPVFFSFLLYSIRSGPIRSEMNQKRREREETFHV